MSDPAPVILVTGASRGLGYATARALGASGAQVIAMARTVGGLEDLADAIETEGGPTPTLVPLSLTDEGHALLKAMAPAMHRAQARMLEPSGSGARKLIEIDVLRLGPEVAESARTSRDDELLGDIADAYWQAGMRDQAIRLWQAAQDFDPGDGEWTGKLRASRSGEDPFR